jgi:hypothetical protein
MARVLVRDDDRPRPIGLDDGLGTVDRDLLVVVVVRVEELIPEAAVPERALASGDDERAVARSKLPMAYAKSLRPSRT